MFLLIRMKQSKFTLSGCVDSVKKGLTRLTVVYNNHVTSKKHVLTQATRIVPVAECCGVVAQQGSVKHRDGRGSSFETYLRGLPKLDPIDRTTGWVFRHTDTEESGTARRKISFGKLPPRGSIRPNPAPSEHVPDTSCLDTSLSRCESDRGTQGRGTPLARDANRPRLDEMCRQLKVRGVAFAKAGRTPAAAVERNSSCRNRATRVQLPAMAEEGGVTCRWKECSVSFASHVELYAHLEACHVPIKMGLGNCGGRGCDLLCHWRECSEARRGFAARYKLLLHLQRTHCRGTLLGLMCVQVREGLGRRRGLWG